MRTTIHWKLKHPGGIGKEKRNDVRGKRTLLKY